MDIKEHGLCHLHQIRPMAIDSDHLPVGKFPTDIQLSGDLFTHHADLSSTMNEHGKFVGMDLSENIWRGPAEPEFGASGVIFQAGEGRNKRDFYFLWCGRGPGSNSFVFGN